MDNLVSDLNNDKISLIPPFQRGHAWSLPMRRKLMQTIIKGRPIPAIFIYKEPQGVKFVSNILDGKQRLEAMILFIGAKSNVLKIDSLHTYFKDSKERQQADFKIKIDGKMKGFVDLDSELIRNFQDYKIPSIEIQLDETTSIDEMIELFVAINTGGRKVGRIQIVNAILKDDAFLRSIFDLIGIKQKRGRDYHYKAKKTSFTSVLMKLTAVENLKGTGSRLDHMWGLIVEIVSFMRTKEHKSQAQVLSAFIKSKKSGEKPMSKQELRKIRTIFEFFEKAYKNPIIRDGKVAANQVHFYTVMTSIINENLMDIFSDEELERKLGEFSGILDKKSQVPNKVKKEFDAYLDLSEKQTTHPGRRKDRQANFVKIINAI